ncbi:MAG: pseudouridine synthase [Gemmatimonadaceae bacterium]
MAGMMRIHRALARAGVASRRQAELLIGAGRVLVNGAVAKVGQSVDPLKDRVLVDGQEVPLAPPKARWFVLNKPTGVMTTKRDPEGRRTVFDFVPETPGLTYVGRLDFLTEGVLLLTTDGEAAHRLTHPSSEVERVYQATVRGNAKAAADAARKGVELDDGLVKPAWVNVLPMENRRWSFEIAIREGKTREVRRLCAALELEVERLVRTQFGPVRIGKLPAGEWRELNGREISLLEVVTGTDIPSTQRSQSQRRRERERHDTKGSAEGEGSTAQRRPRKSRDSRPAGAPGRPAAKRGAKSSGKSSTGGSSAKRRGPRGTA